MSEILKAVEFNAQTGITIERELTKAEVDFHNALLAQTIANEEAMQSKVAARESALAKLAALGLTEAEIAAL
jgi:DNA-binding NarL/FixJ family response regulator